MVNREDGNNNKHGTLQSLGRKIGEKAKVVPLDMKPYLILMMGRSCGFLAVFRAEKCQRKEQPCLEE